MTTRSTRCRARSVAAALILTAVPVTGAADPFLLPNGGAPPDTALWVLNPYFTNPVVKLFGPDGAELPIVEDERPAVGRDALGVTATDRFPGFVWRPVRPLVVGGRYEFRLLEPPMSTFFTVVAVPPGSGPPAVPDVDRTEDLAENTADQDPCVGHDTELHGHAYTRVDVSTEGAFTVAYVDSSSGVALQAVAQAGNPTARFAMGTVDDDGAEGLPVLVGEDPTPLRFGAFDLAGRFSGWTEPHVIDPPAFPEGGCAVVTGGPALWFAVVLAVRQLARRRRTRADAS